MQDWVGTRCFPEGVRLMWNWKLNRNFYPNWDNMVKRWKDDGVKPMIYINPYFANLSDPQISRDLFKEGYEKGYFLKNKNNEVYLTYSVSI
jgi:alpha-glucosidase (family GH31 glycosyl hydrolase)